jgi:hypothetical protein
VVIGVPKSDTLLAVRKSRKPAWVRSRITLDPIDGGLVCSG